MNNAIIWLPPYVNYIMMWSSLCSQCRSVNSPVGCICGANLMADSSKGVSSSRFPCMQLFITEKDAVGNGVPSHPGRPYIHMPLASRSSRFRRLPTEKSTLKTRQKLSDPSRETNKNAEVATGGSYPSGGSFGQGHTFQFRHAGRRGPRFLQRSSMSSIQRHQQIKHVRVKRILHE